MRIDPMAVLNLIYGIMSIFSDSKKGRKLLKKLTKYQLSVGKMLEIRSRYELAVTKIEQGKEDVTLVLDRDDLLYLEKVKDRIF